jgi:hypothetical protein
MRHFVSASLSSAFLATLSPTQSIAGQPAPEFLAKRILTAALGLSWKLGGQGIAKIEKNLLVA